MAASIVLITLTSPLTAWLSAASTAAGWRGGLVEVLQDRVGQPGPVPTSAAPQQGHDPLVGELQAVRRGRDGTEDLHRGLVRQHGESLESVGIELEQRRTETVHGQLASPDGLLVLAGQRLDGQTALADPRQRPVDLPIGAQDVRQHDGVARIGLAASLRGPLSIAARHRPRVDRIDAEAGGLERRHDEVLIGLDRHRHGVRFIGVPGKTAPLRALLSPLGGYHDPVADSTGPMVCSLRGNRCQRWDGCSRGMSESMSLTEPVDPTVVPSDRGRIRRSVLDLSVVPDGRPRTRLRRHDHLAQPREGLGFDRLWVTGADMPTIAGTSPPVLIAHLAA